MSQSSSLFNTYRSLDSLTKLTIIEFQKDIHKNRFFNNKQYLINNSTTVAFNQRSWHLRPEFFSYDYYGSAELYRIVLLVNDISTRFNFRESRFKNAGIIAPSLGAVQEILSQNIQ